MNRPFELNQEQIDHLFKFVKSKYVRHIDLQYEVVDHLASSIEEEMMSQDIGFEEALNRVYGRFPITGFAKFLEGKEGQLTKYWYKQCFKYFIEFFTIPKILITILMGTSFYWIFRFQGVFASLICFLILSIGVLIYFYYDRSKMKKIKELQENYLFLQIYYGITLAPTFMYSSVPWVLMDDFHKTIGVGADHNKALILTCFMTFYLLYTYICVFRLKDKLKEELQTKYAHLNIPSIV